MEDTPPERVPVTKRSAGGAHPAPLSPLTGTPTSPHDQPDDTPVGHYKAVSAYALPSDDPPPVFPVSTDPVEPVAVKGDGIVVVGVTRHDAPEYSGLTGGIPGATTHPAHRGYEPLVPTEHHPLIPAHTGEPAFRTLDPVPLEPTRVEHALPRTEPRHRIIERGDHEQHCCPCCGNHHDPHKRADDKFPPLADKDHPTPVERLKPHEKPDTCVDPDDKTWVRSERPGTKPEPEKTERPEGKPAPDDKTGRPEAKPAPGDKTEGTTTEPEYTGPCACCGKKHPGAVRPKNPDEGPGAVERPTYPVAQKSVPEGIGQDGRPLSPGVDPRLAKPGTKPGAPLEPTHHQDPPMRAGRVIPKKQAKPVEKLRPTTSSVPVTNPPGGKTDPPPVTTKPAVTARDTSGQNKPSDTTKPVPTTTSPPPPPADTTGQNKPQNDDTGNTDATAFQAAKKPGVAPKSGNVGPDPKVKFDEASYNQLIAVIDNIGTTLRSATQYEGTYLDGEFPVQPGTQKWPVAQALVKQGHGFGSSVETVNKDLSKDLRTFELALRKAKTVFKETDDLAAYDATKFTTEHPGFSGGVTGV